MIQARLTAKPKRKNKDALTLKYMISKNTIK